MLKEKLGIRGKDEDPTGKDELKAARVAARTAKIWTDVIAIFEPDLGDHAIVAIHGTQEPISRYVPRHGLEVSAVLSLLRVFSPELKGCRSTNAGPSLIL